MKKLIVGVVLVIFFLPFLIHVSTFGEILPMAILFLLPGCLLIFFGWKDYKRGSCIKKMQQMILHAANAEIAEKLCTDIFFLMGVLSESNSQKAKYFLQAIKNGSTLHRQIHPVKSGFDVSLTILKQKSFDVNNSQPIVQKENINEDVPKSVKIRVKFWKPNIEEAKNKHQFFCSWEPDTSGWIREEEDALIISGASRFSFLEKYLSSVVITRIFVHALFETIRQKERRFPYKSISKIIAAWRPHRSSFWDGGDTECGIVNIIFEEVGGKREICSFSEDSILNTTNVGLQSFWKYCSAKVGNDKLEIRDKKMSRLLSN